ncbi:hypothetical protein DFA_10405 [Cavenderia fasciculata]|uniref:Uncharacterized protein n=1 Tax=Cavenderia fasciculata TaxID=261658 RepID=F4QA44_CACFS|nr:uncharacterized protein DFA_10405 [Cavenderia fasciculata]EGG15563.1 hypothetical protein DFA_10405 [Cavenderia fasciculata]|eukprot:XP_004354305.1 hypothetical protein DFA_10405 [Cavenderia fasciculata]
MKRECKSSSKEVETTNNNSNNNNIQSITETSEQDILDLVHKLCDNTFDDKESISITLRRLCKYLAVRDKNDYNKMNQDCVVDGLTNETKIKIRSLLLDTFEGCKDNSNLKKLIELLLTNRYKRDSNDEEIFRFGIIKWFNNVLKHQSNENGIRTNMLISTSTIYSVLVVLSNIKQPCQSELVFETLEAIWRLHYKGDDIKTLKEIDILILITIFKHYQFRDNQQQVQLKQDIINSIYNCLSSLSHLLKNKEFQVFFKQTIGILFQSAYDDEYFIPQQQSQLEEDKDSFKQFSILRKMGNEPQQRFRFLQCIDLNDQTIFTIILDHLKESLSITTTPPTWKDKLIVLKVLNYIDALSMNYNSGIGSLLSVILNSNILQRIFSFETQDNVLVHYELLVFIFKLTQDPDVLESSSFIINEGWQCIINHKQDPIHALTLYTLCYFINVTKKKVFSQDLIDQVFEQSLQSNHKYLVDHAKELVLNNTCLVSERLAPFMIGFLDTMNGVMETNNIIKYFNSLETSSAKTKREYLNRLAMRMLLLFKPPNFAHHNMKMNSFIFTYLLGWILDGSIGKNAVIYLPAIMKVMITQLISYSDIDRLVRICEKFPDKVYSYMNHLIPRAIDVFNDANHTKLMMCLLTICLQFSQTDQQLAASNQLFQHIIDIFVSDPGDSNWKIQGFNGWIEQVQRVGGISPNIEQKKQIIDWIKNGIPMVHIQLRSRLQFSVLRQYSKFIHQITTAFGNDDDTDYYLEIGIYHVEKMLEGIKNNVYVSDMGFTITNFHKLFKTIQFSCQANNIWSNHFKKYLMTNITNNDHLQSLLFLTKLNDN